MAATPDSPSVRTPAAGAGPLERFDVQRLARHCMAYREALDGRAVFQLVTTLVLYLLLCAALLWGAATERWIVGLLALPAGGLLVRLFTIQHDCGHGSFFTARWANTTVGRVLSILTLVPYGYWRRAHALHHASAGDLSRRGIGDVDTLTVCEYRALSKRERLKYRLYRHPLILHVVGPPLYFVLLQRSPFGQALPAREAWRSLMGLNVALVFFYGALVWALGAGPVAVALLPVTCIASWIGAWLFFVQHQFEHTRWDEAGEWDLQVAALDGSSYYVLPPVLQWFTGNIGLHHVHHLNSRVPNYRLQDCLKDNPTLATLSRLTLGESFACIGLALWDEEQRKLVRFSSLR